MEIAERERVYGERSRGAHTALAVVVFPGQRRDTFLAASGTVLQPYSKTGKKQHLTPLKHHPFSFKSSTAIKNKRHQILTEPVSSHLKAASPKEKARKRKSLEKAASTEPAHKPQAEVPAGQDEAAQCQQHVVTVHSHVTCERKNKVKLPKHAIARLLPSHLEKQQSGRRRLGVSVWGSCRSSCAPHGPHSTTPRGNMQPLGRVLAVAGAVVLLLAIVAADEPTSPPDPTPPAGGQEPEPVSRGKLEASGDSEPTSPPEQLTRGVTPVSLGVAERLLTDDTHLGGLDGDSASLDALNSGTFNLDPLAGDAQSGPAGDLPAQSNESQESVDHDTDSEEALASQVHPDNSFCFRHTELPFSHHSQHGWEGDRHMRKDCQKPLSWM
ncbi:hypothetical protein KIL84_011986 [Mauremys mutica]|uniref:Uncharacterized protein n=1 Tax=Mauremys mutica TaxID=74926 RepID=A0A9D3XAQ7_9SAUR|nr:hypothetical protein KIL84_011986 [Mauremys mutica]